MNEKAHETTKIPGTSKQEKDAPTEAAPTEHPTRVKVKTTVRAGYFAYKYT